jgi:glycosyltransferase involved in cell wall biosynthesis
MAAGNVPVASHLPGVADLVGNEGFTFPAGKSKALQEILVRIRDDVALRAHRASLAQSKSQLYSWERTVFEYERIFNRLGNQPRSISTLVPAEVPVEVAARSSG